MANTCDYNLRVIASENHFDNISFAPFSKYEIPQFPIHRIRPLQNVLVVYHHESTPNLTVR